MTPEQAKLLCKVFLDAAQQEAETTKKVIKAVPDGKKSYKPAEKSMTAHELAWHIASSEVMFLDYILTGKFPAGGPPEAPPTIDAILDWYESKRAGLVSKVRDMSGEQLAAKLPFIPGEEHPAVIYLNFMNLHGVH